MANSCLSLSFQSLEFALSAEANSINVESDTCRPSVEAIKTTNYSSSSEEAHFEMATRVQLLCLLLLTLLARGAQPEDTEKHLQDDQQEDQQEYVEEQQTLRLQLAYELWQRQCELLDKEQKETPQTESDAGISTRIARGELAEPGMYPFMAALLLELRQNALRQCGGSLIALQFVLTAAHCLTDATRARVYLGTLRYADAANASEVFQVPREDFKIYPGYLGFGGYNDLALLRLPRPATPTALVQPIALARPFMQQPLLAGKYVSTAGWGALGDGDARDDVSKRTMESNLLHFVQLQVQEQPRCICAYLPGLVSARRHICSSGLGGRGACSGDSGGPLVYYWHNVSYLIGLTTFGSAQGCELGVPTVYTRITAYLEWITSETGGATN